MKGDDLPDVIVFRRPTLPEARILKTLASAAATSKDAYLNQAIACYVRVYDEDGDLELYVPPNVKTIASDRDRPTYLLAEGIYRDEDGMIVDLMLHGSHGRLEYLEKDKPRENILNAEPPESQIIAFPAGTIEPSQWDALLRNREQKQT